MGQNWTQLGLGGKVILSLALDSKSNLYAGSLMDGIFKSSDLGGEWLQYQAGIYKKGVYRLKINKQDDIFIGSEGGGEGWNFYGGGGVFRSTDMGITFEQVGLPISLVKNFVFSGDSLIIASTPSGIQKYNRFLKKWTNIGLHNVEAVTITPSDYLYAATLQDGLFKTTDFGKSWHLTNLTIDTLMSVYNVLAVNDDTLFASTSFNSNLRRSTDGGESWNVLPINTGETYRALYFNNNNLYVTGFSLGSSVLYKTSDLGFNFDSLCHGFETLNLNNSVSATKNGYIFIASYGSTLRGVLRSSDMGATWEQIFTQVITPTIFSDKNGIVITAFDSVYLSDDYGSSWVALPQPEQGEMDEYITDIKKNETGKYFFGTTVKGIYEVDVITETEDVPLYKNDFSLSRNYPNPFNPTTMIRYSIPESGLVRLKVYDILGEEVQTLVNEYKHAGSYETEFDGRNLSSGVYIYAMKSGDFVKNRKMLLVK